MTDEEALEKLIGLATDPASLALLGQIADDSAGACGPYAINDNADLRTMYGPLMDKYHRLGWQARDKRSQLIRESIAKKQG